MAETAKSGGQRAASARGAGRTSAAEADRAELDTVVAGAVGEPRAGDETDRRRPAMLNLPFVTAQFRAPRQPGGGTNPTREEPRERAAVDA